MRVRQFLRVIIVLAFAGLFVAGALSMSKLLGLALPCGATHGCDIVNNHPSSRWFGVPVAYIGFIGYFLIGGLALARASMSPQSAKRLALWGYLVSAFGALTSVGLQIYSLTVIQATCLWCLTSAAVMIALLILHALEYGDRTSEETERGSGEFMLASALGVVVAIGLVGFGLNLKKSAYQAPEPISAAQLAKAPLIPEGAHVYGDKDAPVTIVEFADLMCPSCQQNSPKVKEFVTNHPGKVKLVYRNFPLEQLHPLGMVAAGIGEVAADEGKFWDYIAIIMATGENMKEIDRLWEVAAKAGLDRAKVEKRLQNSDDPAVQRLTRDINAAGALGLTSTPTFLVQAPGMETQAYGYTALMDALEKGPYKDMVGSK